jgi:hypothetical protein
MPPRQSKRLGVYCLEGRWVEPLHRDRTSIRGLLDYLKSAGLIEFDHHRTRSPRTLKARMIEWNEAHPSYELGYFAGHGSSYGRLDPRTRFRMLSLDQLAAPLAGQCAGRVVFLATCVTARNASQMTNFLETTGAIAVCGYRKSIEWTEAFAADTLIIDALARHRRSRIRPLPAFRDVERRHRWISDRLGFVYFIRRVPEDERNREVEGWIRPVE